METLGPFESTPKSGNWILDLFWPRLRNRPEAETALRVGMYVCFLWGIGTTLMILIRSPIVLPNVILLLIVGTYLFFLGIGVRAGSRIASVAVFTTFVLGLANDFANPPSNVVISIIGICAIVLMFGSLRASFFPVTERPPAELVDKPFRARGFEARVKRAWKLTSPVPQLVITVAWCLITYATLFSTFLRMYGLATESMEPTLYPGELVTILKYPFAGRVRRGDAVLFFAPYDRTFPAAKRVVALPGDHVQVRGNRLILNGQAVNEPYLKTSPATPPEDFPAQFPQHVSNYPEPVYNHAVIEGMEDAMYLHDIQNGEYIVPVNKYFMLGDNRGDSLDSRYYGAVARSDLLGRLIHISRNPQLQPAARVLRLPLGAH